MNSSPPLKTYHQRVYLKPGELHIASSATLIETVLGSCVAILLYCPRNKMGAACHAALPQGAGQDFKYVNTAFEHMMHSLLSAGASRGDVVAKVFGGADVLACACGEHSVGQQNIESALNLLCGTGIQVVKMDVGGELGRKLVFFSDSGRAFVKKLGRWG